MWLLSSTPTHVVSSGDVPAERAQTDFVLDAWEQALHDRRPLKRGGLIHHSDRGSQYLSIKYTERLAEADIEPSVGSVGVTRQRSGRNYQRALQS